MFVVGNFAFSGLSLLGCDGVCSYSTVFLSVFGVFSYWVVVVSKKFARFSLWGDSPFLFLAGFHLIIKRRLGLEMCSGLSVTRFRVGLYISARFSL